MNTIKIKGMSCQHCVASTKERLEKIPGITDVKVDLDAGEAHFNGDVDLKTVEEAIVNAGFQVI